MSSNNPLPLADTADTPTTDKYHPVDTDNAPLTWDGNAACIAGVGCEFVPKPIQPNHLGVPAKVS